MNQLQKEIRERQQLLQENETHLKEATERFKRTDRRVTAITNQLKNIPGRIAAYHRDQEARDQELLNDRFERSGDFETLQDIQRDKIEYEREHAILSEALERDRHTVSRVESKIETLKGSINDLRVEQIGSQILDRSGRDFRKAWAIAAGKSSDPYYQVEFADVLKRLFPVPPERPTREKIEAAKRELFSQG